MHWRNIGALMVALVAGAWFCMGLVGPLTPSDARAAFSMILLFAVAPGVSIAAAGELLGPGRGRLAFRVLGGTLLLVGTLIGSMSGPHTDKPSASDIRASTVRPDCSPGDEREHADAC